MAERPILFSGPMVRAILAGAKTQTRRVVKPQPPADCTYAINGAQSAAVCAAVLPSGEPVFVPPTPRSKNHLLPCPYGAPDDDLWVRETWASHGPQLVAYQADGECGAWIGDGAGGRFWLFHGWVMEAERRETHELRGRRWGLAARGGRWRPSIHMPRWASRITLRVTSVRVERLHAISEDDARAEGIVDTPDRVGAHLGVYGRAPSHRTARGAFAALWSEINGDASWDANPWVWVVGFERAEVSRG